MPDEAGLGVQVAHDLGGQMRFCPDVQWCSQNWVPRITVSMRHARRPLPTPSAATGRHCPTARYTHLSRHPAQAQRPGQGRGRLRDRRAAAARCGWSGEPVRHRIAGPCRGAGDCGARGQRPAGLEPVATPRRGWRGSTWRARFSSRALSWPPLLRAWPRPLRRLPRCACWLPWPWPSPSCS